MRNVLGLVLVLAIATLVLGPSPAVACRSCDNPSFWGPGTCSQGCTYCTACNICCGGDPNAGGNCEFYCGGVGPSVSQASAPDSLSQIFDPAAESIQVPPGLITPVAAQRSTSHE